VVSPFSTKYLSRLGLGLLAALAPLACGDEETPLIVGEPGWIQLFNGRDLDDWTVKIRLHELGDNFAETFRVEDGLLKMRYDKYDSYDQFSDQFGHLFYNTPYSHYRLRIEYRFVGEQCPGGPGWAVRNSGVMLHCQPPDTMQRDQDFPVSIEAQMLGGDGQNERTTANLCTPGTHVEIGGNLIRRHCTDSTSDTYHGERWVTMELEVRGEESIRHIMEGRTVLEYAYPVLDDSDAQARRLTGLGFQKNVATGYIAIQAESHPLDVRRIELFPLSAE